MLNFRLNTSLKLLDTKKPYNIVASRNQKWPRRANPMLSSLFLVKAFIQIDNSKIYPTNIFNCFKDILECFKDILECFKDILADRLPSYKGTLEILMWKK